MIDWGDKTDRKDSYEVTVIKQLRETRAITGRLER